MTDSSTRDRGTRLRLGVYADLLYRRERDSVTADFAFARFLGGLATRVRELVVFGRLAPGEGREHYELPPEARFEALPFYASVTDVPGVLRALRPSRAVFERELRGLDAVWLFGPHPLALAFARAARRRGIPFFLGVRQDFPRYIGSRLPSRLWLPALGAAHALEHAWRRLARDVPAVVVGEELAARYRRGRAVLPIGVSLVREADLLPLEEAAARSWEGELRLLWVGRVDPEKDPLRLPEVLARLRQTDPRWRLTLVGEGSLAEAVVARARELGLADAVDLAGYVANGPDLWARYRSSHALVNVSLTEGVPQVFFEAQAAGLPVVATDVGGVRAALRGGEAGLLVPPGDPAAAAAALERLRDDAELRRRLIEAGLSSARENTMDAQLDRVLNFFEEELPVLASRGD